MVICLERGADLHVAQLMLLPLAVSCFSKIQIGFTFLVPADPDSPGQRFVKRVCVCVCVCVCVSAVSSLNNFFVSRHLRMMQIHFQHSQGTKVRRYNSHSAGYLGWPFPMLKY